MLWNQRSQNFFYKFSRNELPKSVCSVFNLDHEVHTCNTRNSLLIYIPRMSTSQYDNHSLRGDGVFIWNKVFKDYFPDHDLTSLLKLKSFQNDSCKLTKMNCKLLTHVQTVSFQFFLLNVFL